MSVSSLKTGATTLSSRSVRGSSMGKSCPTRRRPTPPAQRGHDPDGLERDARGHLAVAHYAVPEHDRDLDHAESGAQRPVRELDLENVALTAQGLEVDLLQHGAA